VILTMSKKGKVKDQMEKKENDKEKFENQINSESYIEALEFYFNEFDDFFKNDAAKGVFLLGVATGKLLRAQKKKFKSNENIEPFWKSLFNLVLNKRKIMMIHTKVIAKSKQYKKYMKYPANLFKAISHYLMKAGDSFGLSEIEISWFFSQGLSTYREITNKNLIELLNPKNK